MKESSEFEPMPMKTRGRLKTRGRFNCLAPCTPIELLSLLKKVYIISVVLQKKTY